MTNGKGNNQDNPILSSQLEAQRKEHSQNNIKRLILGAKAVDLSILDEIISENDFASMFAFSDTPDKISKSLAAVKEFCTAIRNIK